MKNSIKAALLSGLFFPGTGHLALKQYKRGLVLMLTVGACMSYVIMKSVEQAFSILDRLDTQNGALDMQAITNAATQASENSGSLLVNVAMFLILVCWIFAIFDAYAIGKEMDNK